MYYSPNTTSRRRVTCQSHTAGQHATEAFYDLNKHGVLDQPQYKRLAIGTVKDEESLVVPPAPGMYAIDGERVSILSNLPFER